MNKIAYANWLQPGDVFNVGATPQEDPDRTGVWVTVVEVRRGFAAVDLDVTDANGTPSHIKWGHTKKLWRTEPAGPE